jgi:organic hydroperoxide reductase OsmC/OhrA
MLHKIRSAMHLYTAKVVWKRDSQVFVDGKYSRRHTIEFDGGVSLPGSSSPVVVPVPLSDPAAVDPEEVFVSALSACHMLWFLSIAIITPHCQNGSQKTSCGERSMSIGR